MAENTRNPPQQPSDPSRQTPDQQQKQGQPRPTEPGHNPGGQADDTNKTDPAARPDQR